MSWSSRRKLGISLLIILALFSWIGWQMVERAVLVESASHFLVPGMFVAGMVVTLFLGALLWQERGFVWLGASFLVFPSALAALSLSHAVLMFASFLLAILGLQRVQSELAERVHLSVRKSLLLGLTPLLLALSLLVSSQYYMHVQTLSWERLVPSFNLGEGMGPQLIRLVAPFYPEIRELGDEGVTVDRFLQNVQSRERTTLETLPPSMQELVLASELDRAKEQLSQLLGREVQGGESMQMLLGEVVHRKTVALFSSEEERRLPVPVLPFFLSLLLFLTVYPLLAFLAPVFMLAASGFFRLGRTLGWIEIKTESVEREVIMP